MDKEVLETLKEAKIYLNKLTSLEIDLETAVKQITTTFEETNKNIRETFTKLKMSLMKILERRENVLLDQSRKIRNEATLPLNECHKVLREKITATRRLIDIGGVVISGQRNEFDKFMNEASLLGSLPEVPQLKEVPYISFQCQARVESDVVNILEQFGEVSRIAPVQITQMTEKPGAVLVEWNIVDNEDRMTDIQEFRLQRAFGDVNKEKRLLGNFIDCFKGLETQYLVKDLQRGQPYSFRVSCKFEGISEWSSWSLPQVFCTNLRPFTWQKNPNFVISGENKIAKPSGLNGSILLSEGPQFFVGHSIEFTFLETDNNSSEAIIGLLTEDVVETVSNLKFIQEGSFLINQKGQIFVNGVEKSTVLPPSVKGQKICFSSCVVNSSKIRMNIDSNDKRVTYDWPVQPDCKMYFVAQFRSTNWKIFVE